MATQTFEFHGKRIEISSKAYADFAIGADTFRLREELGIAFDRPMSGISEEELEKNLVEIN